ncbi:MAG: hypothetical protein GY845_03080 [Planctomycetes bacterium]|nr:hypothetical protein [Planctomycetota bacterium]
MKITADKEALDAITKLCDIALKTAGLSNMQAVSVILNSMTLEPIEPKEDEVKEG